MISRKQLEAMPGFDPAFHLGEKPAAQNVNCSTSIGRSAMSEKEFMAAVIAYAESRGWLVYHTHDSRRSKAGFPDLCMARKKLVTGPFAMSRPRIIFAELKTETGKESAAQAEWRKTLEDSVMPIASNIEVHLWRPSDWAEIERILT